MALEGAVDEVHGDHELGARELVVAVDVGHLPDAPELLEGQVRPLEEVAALRAVHEAVARRVRLEEQRAVLLALRRADVHRVKHVQRRRMRLLRHGK